MQKSIIWDIKNSPQNHGSIKKFDSFIKKINHTNPLEIKTIESNISLYEKKIKSVKKKININLEKINFKRELLRKSTKNVLNIKKSSSQKKNIVEKISFRKNENDLDKKKKIFSCLKSDIKILYKKTDDLRREKLILKETIDKLKENVVLSKKLENDLKKEKMGLFKKRKNLKKKILKNGEKFKIENFIEKTGFSEISKLLKKNNKKNFKKLINSEFENEDLNKIQKKNETFKIFGMYDFNFEEYNKKNSLKKLDTENLKKNKEEKKKDENELLKILQKEQKIQKEIFYYKNNLQQIYKETNSKNLEEVEKKYNFWKTEKEICEKENLILKNNLERIKKKNIEKREKKTKIKNDLNLKKKKYKDKIITKLKTEIFQIQKNLKIGKKKNQIFSKRVIDLKMSLPIITERLLKIEKKKNLEKLEFKKIFEKPKNDDMINYLKNLENFTNHLLIFVKKNNMENYIFGDEKIIKKENYKVDFENLVNCINNTNCDLKEIDKVPIFNKEHFIKIVKNKLEKL